MQPPVEQLRDTVAADQSSPDANGGYRNSQTREQRQPIPVQDLRSHQQHYNAAAKNRSGRQSQLLEQQDQRSAPARRTYDGLNGRGTGAWGIQEIFSRLPGLSHAEANQRLLALPPMPTKNPG